MRIHLRRTLAVVLVALIVAVAAGAASANRLSVSNQLFRLTWSALRFSEGGSEITCPLTLEGSMHARTFSKVLEALIGYLTRSAVGSCRGSEEVRLNTEALPWHVRYSGFAGTLPNITSMRTTYSGVEFWIRIATLSCHYRYPWLTIMIASGGRITGVRSDETTRLEPGPGNEAFCPLRMTASGTGTATVQNSATVITLSLI